MSLKVSSNPDENVSHLSQAEVDAMNAETSKREVAAFCSQAPDRWMVYLSSDGKRLTTWVGDTLAFITSTGRVQRGFYHSTFTHFRAIGINGAWYYGRHNGPNMYARMRPSSNAPNPELAASLVARLEVKS